MDKHMRFINDYKLLTKEMNKQKDTATLLYFKSHVVKESRKIVERIFAGDHKGNISKHLAKFGPNYSLYWGRIQIDEHFQYDEYNPINLIEIFKCTNELIKLKIENFDIFSEIRLINDSIKWIATGSGKAGYDGLVENYQQGIEDYVIISHKSKGYEQKNKHSWEIPFKKQLSIGPHYEFQTEEKILCINGENTAIKKMVIRDFKIIPFKSSWADNRIISFINKVARQTGLCVLDVLTDFDSLYWLEFFKISKSIHDELGIDVLMKNFLPLMFWDDATLNKNFSKFPTPMFYEFWTKNPRGKSLYFRDKVVLEKLMKQLGVKTHFLENYLFERKLETSGGYAVGFNGVTPIIERFPDNNKFNRGYEQSKVVTSDYGETTHRFERLFHYFDDFINPNFIKDFNLSDLKITGDKYELDSQQIKAIKSSLSKNRFVICGPAGSGKTVVASEIIKYLRRKNESFIYLAPTHKAKRVVEKISDLDDIRNETIKQVIHKPIMLTKYENIIIDEFSMVEDSDWIELLKLLTTKKRIIIIGDNLQLKPIHSTGFLDYLITSKLISYVELNGNHRQKKRNDIQFTKTLREQKVLMNHANYFLGYEDIADYIRYIKDMSDFIFLSPIHGGLFGTKAINHLAVEHYDFKPEDELLITYAPKSANAFLYKGLTLKVESFIDGIVTFKREFNQKHIINNIGEGWKFVNAKLTFEINDEDDIPFKHAKAQTIHASQGSGIPKVCLVIPFGYKIDFKYLYTASTRFEQEYKILTHSSDQPALLEIMRKNIEEHK